MAMTTMRAITPYADSMPLLNDPQALRQRGREDGCLFFKGLLPVADLLAVRRHILQACQKHGWLKEGTDLMDGITRTDFSVIESGDPRWKDFYCDVLKLRDFHALALHDAIARIFATLFGEKALPHSRNICRVMFPQTQTHSTPPHQDHFYIGGSDETWTAWIPLGDCPVELGSLAVVRGTHYQPLSHPVRADSLLPHMGWIDWEEVYADWKADDPVKYYWQDWDLDVQQRGG